MVAFRTLAATGLALLTAAAPAAAAPTVTEFPAGATITSPPTQVTSGPGGTLWAIGTENPGRALSMLPDGTVTEFVAGDTQNFPKDRHPAGIAVGPDGNLWITESGGLVRLTPDGDATQFTSGSVNNPVGITAGPGGRIWFTGDDAIGSFGNDGAGVVEYTTGITPGAGLRSIVAGPDGNLWFTETAGGAIGRITPAGEVTEFSVGVGNAPRDLAVGPDGAIWFTQTGASKGIGRITTAGVPSNFSTGVLPGTPADITAGADGAMWFTMSGDPGAIGRIDMDGIVTSHTVGLTPNRALDGITSGPDGAIWFSQSAAPGHLARIGVPPVAGATSAQVEQASATLTASVLPNGTATSYHFEYGPAGEAPATTAGLSAGAGSGDVAVSVRLDGLRPGTDYTARLVATSDAGDSTGAAARFTTAPAPAGTGDAPAGPVVAKPLPVLGKSLVMRAKRGVVTVKVPGQAKAVPLSELSTLPVGSRVNATNGTVRLSSALPGGKEQSGDFRAGAFVVRQQKTGMTDLELVGGSFKACRRSPKLASASAKRKRVVRSLWGADRNGKFRTHGRNSVASVRGTRWLTQDRCDGTLTKVTEGAVDVYVPGAKRPVRVLAGEKALVRAPRR